MYPSLMGSFSCPTPVFMIGSSFGGASSSLRSMSFHTSHMEDPWILPTPSPSSKPIEIDMLLPTKMIAYQENIECVAEPRPSSSWMEEEDPYVLPTWAIDSSHTHDCLDSVFPLDEAIIGPCLRLSHLGKSYIIDLIFFLSLTVWSVRNLGKFLVRELVVVWFH